MNISRYVKHYNLLFSPDLLQRIATHTQPYCTDKDFPVDKGLSVKEEAQRAFRIARAAWQDWNSAGAADGQKRYITSILGKVLGYSLFSDCPDSGIPANGYHAESLLPAGEQDSPDAALYPITFLMSDGTGRPILPVIVVPPDDALDAKHTFATGQRLSATQMMQAFLNASEPYLWALVTNGSNWRLLRDNPALSRPCYLDIDLDLIMQDGESQVFDSMFWRLFHVSRAEWHGSDGAASCLWEQWRQDLEEHGPVSAPA